MSEQLSFDRRKGFVALPVEVLDIDLSPGAFRTLVELCRMANADGWCWPSLDQLSQKLGRSKSAISGYLKDLRSASLIATKEQRMANGYNYRLKYQVTFWAEWRASLGQNTRPKSERSVRSVERLKESKNHIQKTHPAPAADGIEFALKDWAACFKGAPYPMARHTPAPDLLMKTRALLAQPPQASPDISADIGKKLDALWDRLNLPKRNRPIAEQIEILHRTGYAVDEIDKVFARLAKQWPAHWRQCPDANQFEKRLTETGIAAHARKMALLKGYAARWALAEKTLRRHPQSCSLENTSAPLSVVG